MTTLVLHSQSLANGFLRVLKNTLKGFIVGWMIARQAQANILVVENMVNAGEYSQNDAGWLLADLNDVTIAKIRQEFYND